MKVKICGITSLHDALAAIDAGVDMIGYNFYPPSKRYLTPRACSAIQAELLGRHLCVTTVGVFVNASHAELIAIMDDCDLDLAQLSGDEPPDLLEEMKDRAFKGIRPSTLSEARTSISRLPARSSPPAFLLDACCPGEYGGTGLVVDLELANTLATEHRFLLAGGLRPENVAAIASRVKPWGVDVASGVESRPGTKDASLIRAFVNSIRSLT